MLEKGVQYSASDFITLKSKVKAEMLRRCYTGSLKAYGESEYDFNIVPTKGSQLKIDQANKIIEPINAVDDSGFSMQEIGDPAMAMNVLAAKITSYSATPLTSENHYCKSSCSGLCHTACSSECTGSCTEVCGGNCQSSCTGNCQGSCTGSCRGGCDGGCIDMCSGCSSCTGGCAGTSYYIAGSN